MRYLGIDYGGKRIGVAVSDKEGTIAFPRTTLENSPSVLTDIARLCKEEEIAGIVLGLPVSFAGGLSAQAKAVQRFGDALHAAAHLPLTYENELFTTKIAQTDAGAAALILQSYLDRQGKKNYNKGT